MKPLEVTEGKRAFIVARHRSNRVSHPAGRKTVVILGVERGGTSMVAAVTRALGVDLGERAGRNHEDPRFLSDDESVLKKHIQENNHKKNIWGFKMPKASLKVAFYEKHLVNPHYIIVFRNMASTIDSWGARSGANHFESAKHAIRYYQESINVLSESKNPVAFANYERACAEPTRFAQHLAEFLGVEPGEDSIRKAALVVTGDSAGYVDLPEFYFHMDSLRPDVIPESSVEGEYDAGNELQLGKQRISDQLVFSPTESVLPEEFYLAFDLECKNVKSLVEKPIRVYLDFGKGFFPGHAFRPDVHNGQNLIKVLTNGNAKRVAVGSLNNEYVFGISCFRVLADPEGKIIARPVEETLRERIFKRFINRLRPLKRVLSRR